MRQAYAHDAVVRLAPGSDAQAPGAAITVALCDSWEHPPPCPLAPHHTRADRRDGGEVRLRVLFATEPARETTVRRRIGTALATGEQRGPDGEPTRWRLVTDGPGELRPDETDHAARLARS